MLLTQSLHARFETIFFSTKDRLFSYIRKFTPDQAQAEDILQQAYLKLWENLEQVASDEAILPLLCTYAKHLLIDTFRKAARQKKYQAAMQQAPAPRCHADEQLYVKEYQALLRQAVDKLPPQNRLVYTLKREQGLSLSQIAVRLQISTSTVEGHMNKALKFLKKELKGSITFTLYLSILEQLS